MSRELFNSKLFRSKLFDSNSLLDVPARTQSVSPELRDSVISDLLGRTGGAISDLAYLIDTPRAMLHGAMVGDIGSAFGKAEDRVSGRDVLREYGVIGNQEDDWTNFGLGLAFEIGTDPLALLSGPAKALTTAGKVAKKAGLIDDAAKALSRKALAGEAGEEVAALAAKGRQSFQKQMGREAADLDLYARPLVGKRAAQKYGTLEDLVAYADDPKKAMDDAISVLGGTDEWNKLKGERLSGDLGLGLPFGDAAITFDVPGGDAWRNALDTVGQTARWSGPGRYAAAGFDATTGGRVGAEDQLVNRAAFVRGAAKKAEATRRVSEAKARLRLGSPEAFSEEGNLVMGRLMEGDAVATASDKAWLARNPAAREFLEFWKTEIRDGMPLASEEFGLSGAVIDDEFKLEYLPMQAERIFGMGGGGGGGGKILSTSTPDQMRRTQAMRTPGGRSDIMRISQDPMVAGSKRRLTTDEGAAEYLATELFQAPYSSLTPQRQKNLVRMARILNKLPDDVAARLPLFGQHPAQMVTQYFEGRMGAISNADVQLQSLANLAKNQPFTQVEKGGHVSMAQALKRLGLRTTKSEAGEIGARQQMRQRLAEAFGVADPDSIDLSKVSVPAEHVERLARVREAFEVPEVASPFLKWLDTYTQVWKGSILAWPSRITRDLYSGAFQNWLAGALDPESVSAASTLLARSANDPAFLRYLERIPRYAAITDPQSRIARFYGDLAATNLLATGHHLDHKATVTGAKALDFYVGAEPQTFTGAVAELGSNWENFHKINTAASPTQETLNPIIRAGEKAGNVSDGINRLTGYLSLLSQGYTPEAAAKAIKKVQVDYTTLTAFERTYMKRLFPWYTFQSRIFGEVLQQLLERPGGRYGQAIRTVDSVEEEVAHNQYIPEGLRSQVALPIGSLLGDPGDGVTRYATDFDLAGFDQIAMGSDGFTGLPRQIGLQLAPQARIPAEMIFGQDLWAGEPLGQSSGGPVSAVYRELTGGQDPGWTGAIGDRLVTNTPFLQRPAGVLANLVDSRGGVPLGQRLVRTGLSNTTGVKIRDIDEERIAADQERLALRTIDPYTREVENVYIPESRADSVPQWAQDRLAVARAIARDRRARREAARGS